MTIKRNACNDWNKLFWRCNKVACIFIDSITIYALSFSRDRDPVTFIWFFFILLFLIHIENESLYMYVFINVNILYIQICYCSCYSLSSANVYWTGTKVIETLFEWVCVAHIVSSFNFRFLLNILLESEFRILIY